MAGTIALAAALASTVAGRDAAAQSPAEDGRVRAYTRAAIALYLSQARTIGGIGGGVGVRFAASEWIQLQADVSYLSMVGNAVEGRIGGGLQRPGFYSPSATLMLSVIAGRGLRFLSDARTTLPSTPAMTVGLHVAPLRFSSGPVYASLAEVGLGAGSDFPGLGLLYEASLLEVGASF